jgi:hypothetical protein
MKENAMNPKPTNQELIVVRTRAHLACDASRAWDKVCFYEHIELQPTWLLRTALPVPQRTTGAYRQAGDVSSCQYSDGGYLTKRIRQIREGRVDFDVIEQTIRYAGRIDLKGGSIEVTPLEEGGCQVEMVTYYDLRAAWLRPIRRAIDYVISAMHRIVLADMRARLAPSTRLEAPYRGLDHVCER